MHRSRRTGNRSYGRRLQALSSSSDERLVELVLAGEDAAFEVLFERHVADSLWFAREMLGSWDEAEEAVRHSFAAAHAYLAARDREIEFQPWLQTILGNHCLSLLQARGPKPDERAPVVDLDEWRRRRKLLGAAVPAVPSAALHNSVMAACGIGGSGAAAAGAPLLGGTLAKVAVVALLAGGAGVAGQTVSEHGRPADDAQVERDGGPPARWLAGDPASVHAVPEGRSREAAGRPSRPPRRASGAPRRAPSEPLAHEPDAQAPMAASPNAAAPGVDAPLPAGEVAQGDAPASPPTSATGGAPNGGGGTSPVPTVLQRLKDIGEAPAPAPPPARLPVPVDLPDIRDDLDVTAGNLSKDLRALLPHGTSAPPR